MIALPIGIALLAGLAAVAHLGVQANMRKIQGNPDPYPMDVLSQEPLGEEVYIEREDGTRLRAIVRGQGAPIVFSHGYGVFLLEWNIMWEKLAQAGYRLIAFDHRGHGKSTIGTDGVGSRQMAGDIKAVLEYFEVADGILVGHSMGGFLAIVFMLTYPNVASACLKHCVLMASMAGDVLKGAPQNRVQIPLAQAGILEKLIRNQAWGWAFGASIYGEAPPPSGVEVFRRQLSEARHRELVPALQALAQENYYNRLGEIKVPCVIIYGLNDKTTPAYHSETLHQGITNSQIVRIERAGHVLNWEAPDKINDVIKSL